MRRSLVIASLVLALAIPQVGSARIPCSRFSLRTLHLIVLASAIATGLGTYYWAYRDNAHQEEQVVEAEKFLMNAPKDPVWDFSAPKTQKEFHERSRAMARYVSRDGHKLPPQAYFRTLENLANIDPKLAARFKAANIDLAGLSAVQAMDKEHRLKLEQALMVFNDHEHDLFKAGERKKDYSFNDLSWLLIQNAMVFDSIHPRDETKNEWFQNIKKGEWESQEVWEVGTLLKEQVWSKAQDPKAVFHKLGEIEADIDGVPFNQEDYDRVVQKPRRPEFGNVDWDSSWFGWIFKKWTLQKTKNGAGFESFDEAVDKFFKEVDSK